MRNTKLTLITILLFSFHNIHAYANQDLNDKLFKAVENFDFDTVKQTLNEGADPNYTKTSTTTIGGNTFTTIKSVLGAINTSDGSLFWVEESSSQYQKVKARYDNLSYKMAKLLFENGAILSQIDAEILYHPVTNGHVKVAELLLEKGASPHQKIEVEDGLSLMEIAINYNQTQVVELLEKYGAIPVNPKDILQLNLINAAQYGDSEEIKTAIQKGADVNKPDSAGRYALLQFSKSITSTGNKLKTLLELGADPNMLCDYRFLSLKKISPLHAYIIYTANFLKTTNKDFLREIKSNIKLFLDYGAYPSVKDPHGMTPLHSAAKKNHVIAAKLLIKKGAKVYDKDDNGKMPIDYAQSSQMINLLKENNKENLIYIYILLSVIVGLFAIIALLIIKPLTRASSDHKDALSGHLSSNVNM